jgi:hypothetical protein
MGEGRKRVLLTAASILAARKLAQIDRPCPAQDFCIADAIVKAEKIMREDQCAVADGTRGSNLPDQGEESGPNSIFTETPACRESTELVDERSPHAANRPSVPATS